MLSEGKLRLSEKKMKCGEKICSYAGKSCSCAGKIQCSLLFFEQKYVCIYRGEVVWEMARLGKAKTPQGDQEA